MILNDLVDYVPTALTVFVSVCALLFLKKTKLKLFIAFLCLSSLLMTIMFAFANYFSKEGFNVAVIVHLKFLFDKTAITQFYREGLMTILIIITVIFMINKVYKVHFLSQKMSTSMQATLLMMALTLSIISIASNPFVRDARNLATYYSVTKKDPLPEEYKKISELIPSHTVLRPNNYKNFIIIFVEGLENTFFNESLFPDLTINLNKQIQDFGIEIDGIQNIEMTNWTYSGMEASLCGSINLKDNTLFSKKIECIGNILSEDNYDLSFIGGSNFALESKSMLLKTQGFDNIFAFDDIAEFYKNKHQSTIPTAKWGAFDQSMFEFANSYLSDIDKKQQSRHGLVLLTVDTHIPGYMSPQCKNLRYKELNESLLNSIKCTDQMISQFIEKHIEDYEIFLISDHLYRGNLEAIKKLNYQERSLMFTHLSKNHSNTTQKINRAATNLDIAPTILHSLGYQINSLNFGRNLFDNSQKTLNESIGFDAFDDNVHQIRNLHKADLEKQDHYYLSR